MIGPNGRRVTKHGFAYHDTRNPTYKSWSSARDRCYCQSNKDYHRYGGRGITMDSRWDDFTHFLSDMGERPVGRTLERKDNNGPYSKENCRWATPKEQARNRRNNRPLILYQGQKIAITDLAERLGLTYGALSRRLARGWSVDEIAARPQAPPPREFEFNGVKAPLQTLCKLIGIPTMTVRNRLNRGLSIEQAFTR